MIAAPPLPPAGPPYFLADHPALDFVNTRLPLKNGAWDALDTRESFAEWLLASQISGGAESAAKLRSLPLEDANKVMEEARRLRETLRSVLQAVERPLTPEQQSAALTPLAVHINAILAEAPQQQSLQTEERLEWQQAYRFQTARGLLAPLAHAIGEILMTPDPSRVRACEGADCVLWFLDLSKGNRRRWCSMALCGNRAKVAAHRSRGRVATGP